MTQCKHILIITIAIIFSVALLTIGLLFGNYKITINVVGPSVEVPVYDEDLGDNVFSEDSLYKTSNSISSPTQPTTNVGMATWYNYDCRAGHCVSQFCSQGLKEDGECFSQRYSTCASRDFPKGTILEVENIKSGQKIQCSVNDWVENPNVIIDLSSYAFQQLASLSQGIILVEIWDIE